MVLSATAIILLFSFQVVQFQSASGASIEELQEQFLQTECKKQDVKPEECTVESMQQASHSHLVIEPPCYEGKSPFVLSFNATTISDESAAFRSSLFENGTGQAIPAATYQVSMTEVESNKTHFIDFLHAPNGSLLLNFDYDRESEEISFEGADRERFLNALVATNATEPIVIRSPDISLDRAYNIEVWIIGAYDIRCLFPPDMIPKAEFVWSPHRMAI